MSLVVGGSYDIQQVYALGHNIVAIYLGRQIVWPFLPEDLFVEIPGAHEITLIPGTYRVLCRAGGGAGGSNGNSGSGRSGGTGGVGGYGQITLNTFNTFLPKESIIYVGDKGLTYANGGNGGAAGTSWSGRGCNGGTGGGGGLPSYLQVENNYYFANGGGGGGAGGGAGKNGNYAAGGGGGGGGGYYKFDLETQSIVSVPGQKGANYHGHNGVQGNIEDFPDIYSGGGGQDADNHKSSTGANGGGASGGGGGGNGGRDESWMRAGSGGGGAGGDYNAGGGKTGNAYSSSYVGTNAYNSDQILVDTTAENAEYGVVGNYGMGGETNAEGRSGFVWLRRIGDPEPSIHVHIKSPEDVTVIIDYQGWSELLTDIKSTEYNEVTYIVSKYGYKGKYRNLIPQLYELDDGKLTPIVLDDIIDCEDVNGFVPDEITETIVCDSVIEETTENLIMGQVQEATEEEVFMGILGTGGGSIVTETIDCGGFDTIAQTINLGVANG